MCHRFTNLILTLPFFSMCKVYLALCQALDWCEYSADVSVERTVQIINVKL